MALRWEWACPRWWCISQQMGWLIWLLGMCTYPLLRSRPLRVPPLRRLTLESPKVSKGLLPHHSVPRLGSACPRSGSEPWAAAMGHPWPSAANPASCRVAHGSLPALGQRGLTGRSDQNQKQGGPPAGLVLIRSRPCSRCRACEAALTPMQQPTSPRRIPGFHSTCGEGACSRSSA